ncbi:hypothetical protein J1P26_07430 [Neobacillus sp. MM2021_6]|uniref:hypothetical protein n=1 Tax=Bacillaceae TaxID=186817 RepID=UPI00140D491D|nr:MULTISPECIES: hypothetical protein [Bacillaceae]MBO0959564.1 hypothetical protein [Neobacillus sp. MM2021_6]NHC17138.1 hypothetical protein [Bacillus sp. MM2020_4]
MTVIVSDSFNRADNPTSLGVADTGQVWETYGTYPWGIINNQAYGAINGDKWAVIDTNNSDVVIQFSIVISHNYNKPVWRFTDSRNYYFIEGSGVYKRVNGTNSQIGSTGAGMGNDTVIKIKIMSNTHEIYYNGELKFTFTDNTFLTQTKHGFALYANTTRYDNFLVEDFNTGGTPTTQDGSAALTGTGLLTADSQLVKQSTADLKGSGSFLATGQRLQNSSASLLGHGALSASAEDLSIVTGSANLTAQGILSATPQAIRNTQAELVGTGVLDAIPTGRSTWLASADLLGRGFLTAFAVMTKKQRNPIVSGMMMHGQSRDTISLRSGASPGIHLKSTTPSTITLRGGF